MPEGHTIHRIARDHSKWIGGQKIKISSPQGRFAADSKKISGNQLLSISAHGKHLFYQWSARRFMHVHLGLYGKFHVHKNPPPEPKGAVRIRMQGKQRTIDLNGPNCCELIGIAERDKIRARLGQDPLSSDAKPDLVCSRIIKSKAAIGTLLLNQAIIAGIGNVFRAELLFLTGIHPNTPGRELSEKQIRDLWNLTVKLLEIGVKYNRIISVSREEAGKPLSELSWEERLHVYKSSFCPRCDGAITSWQLGNRKIYACERCQK